MYIEKGEICVGVEENLKLLGDNKKFCWHFYNKLFLI